MDRITGAVGQFRSAVGLGGDEDEDNVTLRDQDHDEDLYFMDDEFNRSCILSTQQRLYGFAICLSLGLLFFFLSMLVILNPVKFAITFTLGNLLGLGSTGFLIGPKQQLTMMLDPSRIVATIAYICSTILALFCALIIRSKLLTLLAIVVEFCALVWYCLSYIPFARAAAKKCLGKCLEMEV